MCPKVTRPIFHTGSHCRPNFLQVQVVQLQCKFTIILHDIASVPPSVLSFPRSPLPLGFFHLFLTLSLPSSVGISPHTLPHSCGSSSTFRHMESYNGRENEGREEDTLTPLPHTYTRTTLLHSRSLVSLTPS